MPESIALKSLDPGMRRGDEKRINQKFLKWVTERFRGGGVVCMDVGRMDAAVKPTRMY
jgi:hypothetical protein